MNGYKIEVDDGILVDGAPVKPELSYHEVLNVCLNSPTRTPDHILDALSEEKAEQNPVVLQRNP